jgi:hypothetical protein
MSTCCPWLFALRYCLDSDHPLAECFAESLLRVIEQNEISPEMQDEIQREVQFRVADHERYLQTPEAFFAHPLGSNEAGETWLKFRDALRSLRTGGR